MFVLFSWRLILYVEPLHLYEGGDDERMTTGVGRVSGVSVDREDDTEIPRVIRRFAFNSITVCYAWAKLLLLYLCASVNDVI